MADINLSAEKQKAILDSLKSGIDNIDFSRLSSGISQTLDTIKSTVKGTNDLSEAIVNVEKAQKQVNNKLTYYEKLKNAHGGLTQQQLDEYDELLDKQEELNALQDSYNEQIKIANKELQKQQKILGTIKNVTDAIVKVVGEGAKKWLEIDELATTTAKAMGMNANESKAYHKALSSTAKDLAFNYGITVKEANELQNAYSNASSKARLLTKNQMEYSVALSQLVGNETLSQMFEQMDNLGSDADAATKNLSKAYSQAAKLGLNASKASAAFAKNLSMANKYSFKNGVDGIMKMTMLSQKLKFNLESMGSMIDKFSNIDSAIETSAKMQVLGGSYAQAFGNPLEAMSMALMNPEELIKKFTEMVKSKGVFDEKTGEVRISPMDRAFLKEAANALGVDANEIMNAANASVRNSHIEKQMQSGLNEAQQTALLNKAQWDTETGKAYIVTKGEDGNDVKHNIEDISANDKLISELMKQEEPVEDIRKNVAEIAKSLTPVSKKMAGLKEEKEIAESELLDKPMRLFDDVMTKFANSGFWKTLTDGSWGTGGMMAGLIGWDILKTTVLKGGDGLLKSLKWLGNGLKSVGSSLIKGIGSVAKSIWGATKFVGKGAWNATKSIAKTAKGAAKGKLGKGGLLALASFGTDLLKDNLVENGSIEKGGVADRALGATSNILGKAGIGMTLGGPWGAAIGAAVGALQSARDEWGQSLKDDHAARMKSSSVLDQYVGYLEQLGTTVLDLGGDIGDTVDNTINALCDGLGEGWDQMMKGDVLKGIGTMCKGIGKGFKELIFGLGKTFKNLWNNSITLITDSWTMFSTALDKFIVTPLKNGVNWLIDKFNKITDAIAKPINWVVEKLKALIDGISGIMSNPGETIVESAKGIVGSVWDGLKNGARSIWDWTQNMFGIQTDNTPHADGMINLPKSAPITEAYIKEQNISGNKARLGVYNTDESILNNDILGKLTSSITPIPTVGQKVNIVPTVETSTQNTSSIKDINLNINGTLKLDGSSIGSKQIDLDLSALFNDPRVKAQLVDMVREEFTRVNGKAIKDSKFYKLGNMSAFG